MGYFNIYGQYVEEDSIYHHGILGMRWGKRNGPPYPLGSGNHSASEKKAGWWKSLDKNFKQKENRVKFRSSGQRKSAKVTASPKESVKVSEKRGLSDRQKKALKIGAAIAGTALAVYGGYTIYQFVESKKLAKGQELAEEALQRINSNEQANAEPLVNGLNRLNKQYSDKELLRRANPKFLTGGLDYQMNCGNCAIAMEALERGYDVQAGPNSTGMTISQIGQYFTGLKSDSFYEPFLDNTSFPNTVRAKQISLGEKYANSEINFAEFIKESASMSKELNARGQKIRSVIEQGLSKQFPEGARGAMFVPSYNGSHWIYWKVGNNGKVSFMNPQMPGLNFDTFFGGYDYIPKLSAAQLTGIRLDDLQMNDNVTEVLVNRVSGQANRFDTRRFLGNNFVMR